MKLKPYPEYKDSGVEWIGEIPENWQTGLLKRFSDKVTDGSHFSPETVEEGKYYITVRDLKEKSINFKNAKKVSEVDFESLKRNGCQPKKGDVILSKDGTIGKCIVVDDNDFVALSSLGLITSNDDLNPYYLRYYLISDDNVSQMYSFIRGSALKRLTINIINNLRIIVPPYEHQMDIISFLDKKTSEIDLTIEKDTCLIELLKEKRTALINHVVTKGLDPTVKMKDSGVEWIGEIPEKGEIIPFRRICNLNQGLQFPQVERLSKPDGNSKIYITIKYIHSNKELKEYIPNPPKRVVCKEDDVLLARTGATGEVVTDQEGVFHNNFFRINYDNSVNKKYLVYYLKMEAIKELLLLKAGVTTIPDLNHDDFLDTPFIIYPLDEQKRIVDYLDTENLRINRIIQKIHQNIELLEEYKKSLIHHVVTGKVDVREVAV